MTTPPTQSTISWQDRTVLRLIKDLTLDEWRAQRPNSMHTLADLSDPSALLSQQLQADSLELFQIATRVAVFFELHQTGVETSLLGEPRLQTWLEIIKSARANYDLTLRFSTSGSTGQPKYITHRLDHLMTEVQFWSRLLPQPATILSVVPSHHLYGFIFSVLLPAAWQAHHGNANPANAQSQTETETQTEREPALIDFRQHPPTLLQQYDHAPTLLIGYPEYWRALIKFNIHLPETLCAISSTAPCPRDVANGLKQLGLSRLIQIYGSSETGAIGWRDDPDAGYQLLPYWQPQCSATTTASPEDKPTYLIQTAIDDETHYPIQDQLHWANENTFVVGPRIDKAVQVGGINVFPEHIAKMLEQLEGIDAVSVRLIRAEEGEHLKAFVATNAAEAEYKALKARIDQFCEQHLKPVERPKAITFGRKLPKSGLGKIIDWPMDQNTLQ